jgi:hypothetical protein
MKITILEVSIFIHITINILVNQIHPLGLLIKGFLSEWYILFSQLVLSGCFFFGTWNCTNQVFDGYFGKGELITGGSENWTPVLEIPTDLFLMDLTTVLKKILSTLTMMMIYNHPSFRKKSKRRSKNLI